MFSRSRVISLCCAALLVGLAGCGSDASPEAAAPEPSSSASPTLSDTATTEAPLPTAAEVRDATAAAERAVKAMHGISHADFDKDLAAVTLLMSEGEGAEYADWAESQRDRFMKEEVAYRADVVGSGVVATEVDTVVVMSFVDSHGSTGTPVDTWTDELTITLTMVRDHGRGEGLDAWMVDEMDTLDTDVTDADPQRHAVTTAVWSLADTIANLSWARYDAWAEEVQAKSTSGLEDRWEGARAMMDENFYSRGGPRGVAVERLRPNRASVLVFATGTQGHSNADGQRVEENETDWEARLRFSMRKVDGRWLMSDLDYVTEPEESVLPLA